MRKEMNDAYAAYLNSNSTDQAALSKYTLLKSEYQNKWTAANGGKSTDLNKNDLLDKKNDLEIDLQAADANIQSLQSKIRGLQGNVAVEASKGAEAGTLLKDADMATKEYAAVKEKYNDATDLSSSSVNNFRQVVFGQPAIEPLPSKRIIISGMAGVSAMVITVLIIILLTYLDSSVKTPAIFSKVVNLKLISMVNFMDLKNKKLSEIVTNTDPNENYKDKQRDNIFRESIRKLRYEIENSGKKIFLFTSTKKGEGKTTIVQAISYSLSLSKKKILIIDTNFCNNDLTVQLNAMPVLQQILPHQMNGSLVKHVKSLASTISEGVFAIGCEYGDYTPSEVLPSENLLHHLHKLTEEYDYIILEGPPLNDFSDSKELAQYVDGVIAIFSATHIIKQLDKESINFFKGLNGKFCGSVLNMVKVENLNSI
ncbi:MAG TPA: AAA family ATPase, partial [Flavipsychrobacter sp.]|nr:AAA family ATPase [Flavipsychrobacter sp.]